MSTLLLLTSALQPSAEVLPGLALLGHQVRILPAEPRSCSRRRTPTSCSSTAARSSPRRETCAG